MRKLTIEEVNRRIKEVHGDAVIFDGSTYQGIDERSRFIHKIHGEWWNTPYRVMKGSSHPIVAKQMNIDANLVPIEEILCRLKSTHGDNVILQESTYRRVKEKAIFTDKEYGEFEAIVYHVIHGTRHPARARKIVAEKNTLSVKEVMDKLPNHLKMVEDTFTSLNDLCVFIDDTYGEYSIKPKYVLCGGGVHPLRTSNRLSMSQRLSLKEIEDLLSKNNPGVRIIYETYIGTDKDATFVDPKYGEWRARSNNVFNGTVHPNREQEKRRKTCLKKYGVDSPSKNRDVFLKIARSSHLTTIKYHWKTGEELVCKASYECKVVDYLNINKINFNWQPTSFELPNGKMYFPDLYLVDRNIWVEIKGYMRDVSKLKWDWFKSEHPTAELWDKKKLKEMGIL
jgi:hypothetical protein